MLHNHISVVSSYPSLLKRGRGDYRSHNQQSYEFSFSSPWGFTLLELIVALFLVSVLAAVILPSFAGFGERKVKSEAREIASILRSLNDSAISRKETYWIKFDLDGNLIKWKSPEGEKTKGYDSLTSLTTQSTGSRSKGEVTIFVEPLGFRENLSVLLGAGDENMTVTFYHLNGKVKIKGTDEL